MQDVKKTSMMMAPGMVIGLLVGLGAGAALGILFAPRKGEETRRHLKEQAMSARNRVQQQMAAQKDKLRQTGQKAAQTTQEVAQKGKEAAQESSSRSNNQTRPR